MRSWELQDDKTVAIVEITRDGDHERARMYALDGEVPLERRSCASLLRILADNMEARAEELDNLATDGPSQR